MVHRERPFLPHLTAMWLFPLRQATAPWWSCIFWAQTGARHALGEQGGSYATLHMPLKSHIEEVTSGMVMVT